MIKLYDKDNGTWLGTISQEQLQALIDHLEEESSEDRDYYINEETLDLLQDSAVDPALVELLRTALNERTEMEIRWSQE